MKEEYDFSQGQRGRFYAPDAEFDIPIYLESDLVRFLREIADRKGMEVGDIVNAWIKKDVDLIEAFLR